MMRRLSVMMWQKLGSIHLTVALCLLLTVDLAWGYFCLNRRTTLFAPLNDTGLASWIETYGRCNLAYTAWFFALVALLTLFCVNTFVCTTDRVIRLIQFRANFNRQRFFLRFAPHLMHYAVIAILAGYLCSYLLSQVFVSRALVPGASLTLPGTAIQITFESFDPIYYSGERLDFFNNHVIQPRAHLSITDGMVHKTAVLTHNQPVTFNGYGIFLKDFAPKKKGGMERRILINMSIRKDPGVQLYAAGMFLFTAGLILYLIEWMVFRRNRQKKEAL